MLWGLAMSEYDFMEEFIKQLTEMFERLNKQFEEEQNG
jgi:hypothetical protein